MLSLGVPMLTITSGADVVLGAPMLTIISGADVNLGFLYFWFIKMCIAGNIARGRGWGVQEGLVMA